MSARPTRPANLTIALPLRRRCGWTFQPWSEVYLNAEMATFLYDSQEHSRDPRGFRASIRPTPPAHRGGRPVGEQHAADRRPHPVLAFNINADTDGQDPALAATTTPCSSITISSATESRGAAIPQGEPMGRPAHVSSAAGNPVPDSTKIHWIPRGQEVLAQVDGQVLDFTPARPRHSLRAQGLPGQR
jgi:hypothetical protein